MTGLQNVPPHLGTFVWVVLYAVAPALAGLALGILIRPLARRAALGAALVSGVLVAMTLLGLFDAQGAWPILQQAARGCAVFAEGLWSTTGVPPIAVASGLTGVALGVVLREWWIFRVRAAD
jgi:hypothetical protein